MGFETDITHYVRCDNCWCSLHAAAYGPPSTPAPTKFFPTAQSAINRALELHWTIRPHNILCPTCTALLDPEANDPGDPNTTGHSRPNKGDPPHGH